jgi:hypothetical protein
MRKLIQRLGRGYAEGLIIWSQVAAIYGFFSAIMTAGTFYAVALSKWVPLWIYVLSVLVVLLGIIAFAVTIGVPAFYERTRQLSHIDKIEERLGKGEHGQTDEKPAQ